MNDVRGRARVLPPVLVATGVLLAACGGSVADADRPSTSRTVTAAAQSPFCDAVAASGEAIAPLMALTNRGGGSAREVADAVDAVRRTNAQVAAAAPVEIRADVDRYLQTMNLQLDAVVAAGGNGAALSRDPELRAQLNAPDAVAANDRVREYVERTCAPAR